MQSFPSSLENPNSSLPDLDHTVQESSSSSMRVQGVRIAFFEAVPFAQFHTQHSGCLGNEGTVAESTNAPETQKQVVPCLVAHQPRLGIWQILSFTSLKAPHDGCQPDKLGEVSWTPWQCRKLGHCWTCQICRHLIRIHSDSAKQW